MNLNLLSSEDSSEDEMELLVLLPNIRQIRERSDLYNYYTDEEFKRRYRLSKACVENLLRRFEDDLIKETNRNYPVSPMNQLLGTLRFYATGSFQAVVGDLLNVHKSTVCRFVHRVSHHIARLAPEYIKMPTTPGEQTKNKNKFYEFANFPGVIGAIDCTHVRITSPAGGDNSELYRNRKGWFSINVQVVCDASLNIMDIVARWPGSVHDSRIFSNSLLRARLEANEFLNCYLVGDSGYMCTNYLLTPLANPTTDSEERYQNAHVRTRNVIERVFGVWKRRFPVLQVGMSLQIQNVLRIIVATAVLHNMANEDRVLNDISDSDDEHDISACDAAPVQQLPNATRAHLINTFFSR